MYHLAPPDGTEVFKFTDTGKLLTMKFSDQIIKNLGMLLLGLVIASCSDTDGPPQDLFGVAASGAAIKGSIYVVDADGSELNRLINTDGTFRFDVRKLTAPFMLKVVAENGVDPDLYSFAAEPNVVVNVTPLSNLAMYVVNGNADPVTLYSSWVSASATTADVDVKNAQAIVNANLRMQLMAYSISPYNYDFITARFAANGTSFDGLLDAISVDITAGVNVDVTGIGALVFDTGIDTTGYDIGGEAVATTGNYTIKFKVAVDGGVNSAETWLMINLPAPDLPVVGGTQLVEDLFVSLYGKTGSIVINSADVTGDAAETVVVLNADITTQDGVFNYVATYTFTQNP